MASWREELGVFNVKGDKVRVTDPCYDKECDDGIVVSNCIPGVWRALAQVTDDTAGWGNRVVYLMACRENFESFKTKVETSDHCVSVDSGQAGIFDEAEFPEGDMDGSPVFKEFYDKCCAATLGKRQADIIDKIGVVSSSGYGDGIYALTVWRDGVDKVLAVRITFITNKDEKEEKDS